MLIAINLYRHFYDIEKKVLVHSLVPTLLIESSGPGIHLGSYRHRLRHRRMRKAAKAGNCKQRKNTPK